MLLSLCMEFNETEGQQPEEQNVAIYSKWAILFFSIFFAPLIGGILLMLNLRSVGYKKEGTRILIFSVLYYFVSSLIITYIAQMLGGPLNNKAIMQNPKIIVGLLILNIIGGGVLAEYFFKKYFPDDNYEYKSIWKALFITFLLIIPLSMLLRF